MALIYLTHPALEKKLNKKNKKLPSLKKEGCAFMRGVVAALSNSRLRIYVQELANEQRVTRTLKYAI